ncbi:NAD(P)-dependent oxidoreductase [Actinomycetospora sp. NBRC 106378]|uniref:NAD-dependent epimerase/dehydratase family protein n=1 Tax=Actinomycetospora sp. NBRC 106378 TaxID=3032208 RepID=UPI0024A348F9|nr:NAD(P)-dependent oxidoreductase [Actinomycetospora sp. NBRC 106378]GLZ53516.1 nucleoside-diphosphate sugar epimerase [Actinomycetospora sp. NBRC 106378]
MPATLITGGTGLIGSAIARRLLARGDDVVLLDVMPSPERISALRTDFPDGSVEVARGDVTALGSLLDLVQRHQVDAIVHLASMLGPDSDADPGFATRTNCEGTTNVLDIARLRGLRRVVLASSIAVFGDDSCYAPADLPLREDAPQWGAPGMRMYSAAKIYCEQLARHYTRRFGVSVTALRPSVVHGQGRRSGATSVVTKVIEDAMFDEPVTVGLGNASMSLIYVEEVADQFVALLDADPAVVAEHPFYNSGGFTCGVRDLAEVVRSILPDAQITVEPSAERDVGGLVTAVRGDLLGEVLGHTPRFATLADGVLHQMNLVRSQSGLPPLESPTALAR